MSAGNGEAVFAIIIPKMMGDALSRAQRGFRPGRFPPAFVLTCGRREPVLRPELHRADTDFAIPRGGALVTLALKKVVVVGCGAVGSHLASLLVSSGMGKILLVD